MSICLIARLEGSSIVIIIDDIDELKDEEEVVLSFRFKYIDIILLLN